jgi:hypothetical protein
VHDPRVLLSPDRLDFAIKHRFFRHLAECGDPDSERVYRWHIEKRTGGREIGSWKTSLQDYVKACGDLLDSMRVRGFDPAYPIRIGNNGRMMEGAHRTSCALYLDIPVSMVVVDREGRSCPWGQEALIEYGIDRVDLLRVLDDFARLSCPRR